MALLNRSILALVASAGLSACAPGVAPPLLARVAPDADPAFIARSSDGTCYGRTVSPAVIETVTEQVLIQPPQIDSNGVVRSPAVYRTLAHQKILRERREEEFPAMCPETMTPDFVATLQRALAARGAFAGPVDGVMSRRTSQALRNWQRTAGGPDSAVLAVATARSLGLVAIPLDELNRE